MNKILISLSAVILLFSPDLAAQLPLLTEKPGTFEILSRTDYTLPECGFTQAELKENLEKIKDVIAVIRENPVLTDIKGYNGRALIHNASCKDVDSYGLPARISFEFCSFFLLKNGKETFNTIEPPEWSLYLNKMNPINNGLTFDNFNTKHGYFTVPLRKKTVKSGIDVYDGECWVIYDPSRPQYWVPVTVEEAFAAVREEIKNDDDKVAAEYMRQFVEKEYSEIPVADRNKPAYFGGNASRISSTPGVPGQDSIFPFIMKVNPEYWNKNLSRADIQFITFRSIQNKEYLRKLKDEYLKANSISYNEMRFLESLNLKDISKLVPLINQ